MIFNQAIGAFRIEDEREGEVGRGFGSSHGIKGEAGSGGEALLGAGQAGRAGRQVFENRVGQGEGGGREGFEDGVERRALVGGRNDLRKHLAIAADVVAIVESADFFRSGFSLIAMEEVERDEGVLKLGEGHALLDGVGSEARESGGADLEDAVELGGGIGAVIPKVRVRVGGAEGAGVFVGDEDEAGLFGVGEDFVEGGGILDGVAVAVEFAIAVVDGDLIPRCRWRRGRRGRDRGRRWGRG